MSKFVSVRPPLLRGKKTSKTLTFWGSSTASWISVLPISSQGNRSPSVPRGVARLCAMIRNSGATVGRADKGECNSEQESESSMIPLKAFEEEGRRKKVDETVLLLFWFAGISGSRGSSSMKRSKRECSTSWGHHGHITRLTVE